MTFTVYATTAVVFLVLDAIMLTLVMKPLFTRHIGPLMTAFATWARVTITRAIHG